MFEGQEGTMARRFLLGILILAAAGLPLAAQAFKSGDTGLDATLSSINIQASADLGGFTAQLSAEFGAKQAQLQTWMKTEKLQPAEVYLVLELGRIAKKPPAAVLATYRKNKGKGWGVVAQAVGVKPGSPEFKALKAAAAAHHKKLKAKKKK
jgi:hypothetical protein